MSERAAATCHVVVVSWIIHPSSAECSVKLLQACTDKREEAINVHSQALRPSLLAVECVPSDDLAIGLDGRSNNHSGHNQNVVVPGPERTKGNKSKNQFGFVFALLVCGLSSSTIPFQ